MFDFNQMGEAFPSLHAKIDAAKNGTRELIAAPGAKKEIWVYYIQFTCAAAEAIVFKNGTTAVTGSMVPLANTPHALGPCWGAPIFKCSTNTAFNVTLGSASDLDGFIVYRVVETP